GETMSFDIGMIAFACTHSGSQIVAVLTRSGSLSAAIICAVVSWFCCHPTVRRLTFMPGFACSKALTVSFQNGTVFVEYSATMKVIWFEAFRDAVADVVARPSATTSIAAVSKRFI